MRITSDEKYETTIGTEYLVELEENRLPRTKAALKSLLLGKRVLINGSPYIVSGIHAHAVPDYMKISAVGLVVKATQ
jgi:hypothetical protein